MNSQKNYSGMQDKPATEFEPLYVQLRTQEKRIYTDQEVAGLPEIENSHVHKQEWEIRKQSSKKLISYLANKKRALKILEVGCGNGWLSYHLSQIKYSSVVGIDINLTELQQAQRVFNANQNLKFIYTDINSELAGLEKFDIVIFSASIQYFISFTGIIGLALNKLNKGGEIHITDSHFYPEEEVIQAERRSRQYFNSKGFGSMHEFYFHHSKKDLQHFSAEILYNPNSILNKILRKNPFYWVRIKK